MACSDRTDGLARHSQQQADADNMALLVSGDFSGLQRFIYTTSSRGALKTLRARSFFLELLSEHVIYEILKDRLSRANIIFSGGGGFCILAPRTQEMKSHLKTVREEMNGWLYKNHGIKLYLGMEWVKVPLDRLLNGSVVGSFEEVQLKLERSKQTKFLDQLRGGDIFNIKAPEQPDNDLSCQICRRDDVPGGTERIRPDDEFSDRACPLCHRLFTIGERLPNVRYIARGSAELPDKRSILIGEGTYYSVFSKSEIRDVNRGDFDALWIINGLELKECVDRSALPMYIANQATQHGELPDAAKKVEKENRQEDEMRQPDSDDMATFSGLARAACGVDRVGVLRADVDNLGAVMTQSLDREDHYLMRLSALSRSLNCFFKLHLNQICRGQHIEKPARVMPEEQDKYAKRYVTVVYAGGDDLFVVGAWDHVAELAFDINRAFRSYTCYNPDVTLSAGVTLHNPKFPIYQMARLSEEAEKAAKENTYPCSEDSDSASKCGLLNKEGKCNRKDSLALFYDPLLKSRASDLEALLEDKGESYSERIRYALKWSEAEENALNIVSLIAKPRDLEEKTRLKLKYLPRGFLYKMFDMIKLWRNEGKLYLPHMAWMISRLRENLRREGREDLAQELNDQLYRFSELRMGSLHVPMTWIDLLSRGGGQNE